MVINKLMMLGTKGLLPPTDDTQHTHFVCSMLLKHSQLPSFFVKNDYVVRVLGGHKGTKNMQAYFLYLLTLVSYYVQNNIL